jgi:TPP-dependent indolepyruvate ferredoxin oxidoreductase alpha subunit
MQIKEHPKNSGKFQFLRYVPIKGADGKIVRSGQKVIKPEEFTPEEREQHAKWRAERDAASSLDSKRISGSLGHHSINRVAEGIEAGFMPENQQQLFDALDRLSKALRKAGIKRPPRPAKQVDTKTGDLLPPAQ